MLFKGVKEHNSSLEETTHYKRLLFNSQMLTAIMPTNVIKLRVLMYKQYMIGITNIYFPENSLNIR